MADDDFMTRRLIAIGVQAGAKLTEAGNALITADNAVKEALGLLKASYGANNPVTPGKPGAEAILGCVGAENAIRQAILAQIKATRNTALYITRIGEV